MFKAVLISLVAGALAVSLAEYFLHYNFIDLLVDKVKKFLRVGKHNG